MPFPSFAIACPQSRVSDSSHAIFTTGGYVAVLEGLRDGEKVVTGANFLIDAESNLRAALQAFTAPEGKSP